MASGPDAGEEVTTAQDFADLMETHCDGFNLSGEIGVVGNSDVVYWSGEGVAA